jgi:hypothetical protein
MSLAQYARSAINKAQAGFADDVSKAGDALVRPFGVLDGQIAQLQALRESTMKAVYAKLSKDKVTLLPIDPASFEKLSCDIETLDGKIAHNQDVLNKLEAACAELGIEDYSLAKMNSSRNAVVMQIRDVKEHALDSVQHLFQAAEALGNRNLAEKNPAVIKAKKEAATTIKNLEVELGTWSDKIGRLEGVLREFK